MVGAVVSGAVVLGALRERVTGEKRVSVSPASVIRLTSQGVSVLVESNAGAAAWFSDADYVAAGATIASLADIMASAQVIACVRPPGAVFLAELKSTQFLVGLLATSTDSGVAQQLHASGAVGLDMTLLPRTISSAQSMDALTSQASVAGYKAVILAADTFDRYFPMMITAAGTVRPTQLLVLGAGIAGLQAIATALRLGAQVTGYDIRAAAEAEIESLGASFLDVSTPQRGANSDGYARELTAEEHSAQQQAVQNAISQFDIVITTASVPGRQPPVLVTSNAITRMRPGSVVIDMAASDMGGNVEGSMAEASFVSAEGITVIGAGSLATKMPAAASLAYARNVADLVLHFVRNGAMVIDRSDPVDAAVVIEVAGDRTGAKV